MDYGAFVIVGQARSGSTLLSRLLADTGHFLLVNDAYFLQYIDDIKGNDAFTVGEARKVADHCLQLLQKRRITGGVKTVNRSIHLTAAELKALENTVMEGVEGCRNGEDVVALVLRHAAALSGARIWGWNTPQDYLNVERIFKHFPNARILFLIRNPWDVLKSYKNLPHYWGQERRRYHPVLQSLVWRQVVEEYRRLKKLYPSTIHLMRYEDIVMNRGNVWAGLQDLIGPFPPPAPAASLDRNSSLRHQPPKPLTWLEKVICRGIVGSRLTDMGYQPKPDPSSGNRIGAIDFIVTSWRSLVYYAGQATLSRDMRLRIRRFGTSLISRFH